MKKVLYLFTIIATLISCKDDDQNVFEKSADERAAEAIANLKQELISPANGWRVKYEPQDGAGSFYVLMQFDENNNVTIKTDLTAEDGAYLEQTVKYRIDNSLGLELILENYSFFSFLFEQDAATFGAEYEFNFVNKTPDNALVFSSKTDAANPTILLFEEATPSDVNLLGPQLAANLNTIANDLQKTSSSLTLTFQSRDLILYLTLDEEKRIITFSGASLKSNPLNAQQFDFTTGYTIESNSIIFESPISGNILGTNVTIESITFSALQNTQIGVCSTPLDVHTYQGVTSLNQSVLLQTSLTDLNGARFPQVSSFYYTPLQYIFNADGESAIQTIQQDIPGAVEMDFYYNIELRDGSKLNGIGFVIQNSDESVTLALRTFTPVLENNRLIFNFDTDYRLFGNTNVTLDYTKLNQYIDKLAEGDQTYFYPYPGVENVFEIFNPCTGWSAYMISAQ